MSHMKTPTYYRNNSPISHIDIDCLWKLENNMLVLVDDDEFISVSYSDNQDKFYKIPNPKAVK